MITAFGIENRSAKVEWRELYGDGFHSLCSATIAEAKTQSAAIVIGDFPGEVDTAADFYPEVIDADMEGK